MNENPKKCSWGDGITVCPDGKTELDPCIYEDVFIARNVTVILSRCVRCGYTSLGWVEQDNTEIILDAIDETAEEEEDEGE